MRRGNIYSNNSCICVSLSFCSKRFFWLYPFMYYISFDFILLCVIFLLTLSFYVLYFFLFVLHLTSFSVMHSAFQIYLSWERWFIVWFFNQNVVFLFIHRSKLQSALIRLDFNLHLWVCIVKFLDLSTSILTKHFSYFFTECQSAFISPWLRFEHTAC